MKNDCLPYTLFDCLPHTLFLAFLFICPVTFCFAQPSNWQPRGVGGGGALYYPSINPANDNEFYVTCDMGELFHSTDYGLSYTQQTFTKFVSGNTSTYEFTSDNNTAYTIATDNNTTFPMRTLDAGNTWTTLPGTPPDDAGLGTYVFKADYANPGRVVLDYWGDIYISNDFGNTFSDIHTAKNAGAGLRMGGVFFDGDNIYIGTNDGVYYSSDGGNSFTELSIGAIPANESIFSFAGAKANGVTRLFCLTVTTANFYNGIQPSDYAEYNNVSQKTEPFMKGVYSMDAGATTWTQTMNGIDITNDFMMYVGMAGNDINTVYLGGHNASTNGNNVLKTMDAGTTWNKVLLTNNNLNIRTGWAGYSGDREWSYGETCFGISVAPNNSNKVLFGDFGFVHKTSDGGANWEQAYVNAADEHPANASTPTRQYYHSIGIENTSSWQVYWFDANNMFACYSDIRGIRSKDAGVSWSFDYSGDVANTMYRIAKDAVNTTMYAGTSSVHDMYQSTRLADAQLDAIDGNGQIIYSTDNGASWQQLYLFNHPVFWVATDPNNQNRMYASVIDYTHGQGGIWMTDDLNDLGTSSWTQLTRPPRTQGHPASIAVLNDGKMVCTFSGRRISGGSTVFTASSGVFLYDPVAKTWTDVSDPAMHYWTKDIIIDPSDPTQNTWYVAVFSGWGNTPVGESASPIGTGGLYKTTNRGLSWTKLTGTQFDRVTSITFNPAVANQAYLTTEFQGLWISNNMNAVIPTWKLVDSYQFQHPERVFFNPYNTSEIWVSSFGTGFKLGTQNSALPAKLISFTGNRNKDISILQWVIDDEETGDKFNVERSTDGQHFNTIATVAGKAGANNQYQLKDTSAEPVLYYRIKIINSTGSYFYSSVIVLRSSTTTGNYIRLLSNPVIDNISLQIGIQQAENLQLSLIDVLGQQLMNKTITVNAGVNQLNIGVPSNCSSGVFILQARSYQLNTAIRVVIKK